MGVINCIKLLLYANKGQLKKAEYNFSTHSGHQELTHKNKISKVHFFVGHPVHVQNCMECQSQEVCNFCNCEKRKNKLGLSCAKLSPKLCLPAFH